jgi:hypothetical protein
VVADALCRKNILLKQLDIKVPSLESLCDLYATDKGIDNRARYLSTPEAR